MQSLLLEMLDLITSHYLFYVQLKLLTICILFVFCKKVSRLKILKADKQERAGDEKSRRDFVGEGIDIQGDAGEQR